jgi:hypothetical protein
VIIIGARTVCYLIIIGIEHIDAMSMVTRTGAIDNLIVLRPSDIHAMEEIVGKTTVHDRRV